MLDFLSSRPVRLIVATLLVLWFAGQLFGLVKWVLGTALVIGGAGWYLRRLGYLRHPGGRHR